MDAGYRRLYVIRYPFERRARRVRVVTGARSASDIVGLASALLGLAILPGFYVATGIPQTADYPASAWAVALGAESLNPLTPLTTLLNYGLISDDGAVSVRIHYDHRVMDGANVARALERFEIILNGPVADEVKRLDQAGAVTAAT